MPTPEKPEGPEDLAEVERALSVLGGRHPGHERARREDEAARAARAAQQRADRARAARDFISRRAILGGGIVAGGILVVVGALAVEKEVTRRSRITASSAPLLGHGFEVVDTTARSSPARLEVESAPGCFLAVETPAESDPATGNLSVTVEGKTVHGKGPLLACTCTAGRVEVASDAPRGGLTLLRAHRATIGGSRAFSFLPFAVGTAATTDSACAEAALDSWIEAKHAPAPGADEAWLADAARGPLRAVGFSTLATGVDDATFLAFEAPENACLLAVSAGAEDPVRLRALGKSAVLAEGKGAAALCATSSGSFVLERPGRGDLTVVSAPAARVGGHAGLREVAAAAHVALGSVAIDDKDLAWSAKQLLVASGVPETLVTMGSTPDIEKQADARLVALSFRRPAALVSDSDEGVFSYCSPALDDMTTESVCVFTGPHVWHLASKAAVAGIARSKRPFWLFAMEGASEPASARAEVEMIALTRKLVRRGFEATTLEAVTETAAGADVLGRTNEDVVIAVSVAPSPPYLFPLTDGPAWSLEGEPRVVAVKPLHKVSLHALRPLPSAQQKRRTVVYRHRIVK